MKHLITCLVLISLTACATMKESIGLGAASGASLGAVIGNQQGEGSQRRTSTIRGAAIGAALGGLLGYVALKGKKEKRDANSTDPISLENTPSLTAPKVRRVWVPARIEGEKYIDGHYMYVIEKTSGWSN